MTPAQRVNLTLRAIMEFGVVTGLGYWGYHSGRSTAGRVGIGLGAATVGFGFWGAVDFHQAGRYAEPLRLLQELFVTGLVAVAWFVAGQPILGWTLAALSTVHHVLVYVLGGRLLKR